MIPEIGFWGVLSFVLSALSVGYLKAKAKEEPNIKVKKDCQQNFVKGSAVEEYSKAKKG